MLFSAYFVAFARTPPTPNITKHKTVKKGDSLDSIFTRNYFPRRSLNNLLHKYPHLKKITLSPNQIYRVDKTKDKISVSIYTQLGKKLSFWHNNKRNNYGVKRINDGLTTHLQTIQGQIHGSLFKSITKQIKNPLIPYKFQDAFLLHYDLNKDILPGAKFKFIIEKKYHKEKFIKYGLIQYAELELKGKLVKRTLLKHKNGFSFANNQKEKYRPFYSPVDYLHFASLYKKRRFHPVKKRYMAHQGVDFALDHGSPIYSANSGYIEKIGYNRRAGKYIGIKHKNGYSTYYNHLSRHFKDLKKGSRVSAGQTIGWIGCTGSCTKAHLHFAVRKNGHFVNPIRLIKSFPFKAKKSYQTFVAKNR